MAWYEMSNDEHVFMFQCPAGSSPELIASIILSQHGLSLTDFDLVEVITSLNNEFCE